MGSLPFMAIRRFFLIVIVTGHRSYCGTGMGGGSILHSRSGVAQEDLLDMVSCGIGVIPLIKNMKSVHTCVNQP